MPTASYGLGSYGADSYGELPEVALAVRERPPLRMHIEVETPNGRNYRWAEDEPSPENVPSGLRWSDTMPGGFESMDCTLPRKPEVDYSDLEQLSTLRVRGASGDIAGEYRLERTPRTSGAEMSISPGAVGWQAHLEDNKSAAEVYVDADLGAWQPPTTARVLAMLAAFYSLSGPEVAGDVGVTYEPALRLLITDSWASPHHKLAGASYAFPDGSSGFGYLHFWSLFSVSSFGGSWVHNFFTDVDGTGAGGGGSNYEQSGNYGGADTAGYWVPVTFSGNRYVNIQYFYNATPGGTDGAQFSTSLRRLRLYGNHGLILRGGPPGGFYASDIVIHAVGKWAPALTTTSESVQQSGFVIPHAVFKEPTTVGEIVRQVTRFGLQDWAVWDNKTFWWHERGTFAKYWRARVAPAQLDETGPQVDRLWESIIVSYQDVDGGTRTVGPPGSGANVIDASLKDNDPDNPANQLGIIRRDVLQMGTSTSAGAIEVGRRFLEESQQFDRSGRARIVGYVEDSSGVVQPYWRPRAGDYISFIDAADTSYRRIVRTDKSHSDRTCNLDLDAPPEGLQALLERLGVVLVPLGLS